MDKKLLTVVIVLLLVAIVAVPAAAKPAIKRLTSPTLLLPGNNAKLTNDDHQVMLEWAPVADARVRGYLVEVEGYSPTWGIWMGFTTIPRETTNTWYQVDCFPCCSPISGFYEYRWRVTALSSEPGSDSAPSNWKYFSFPDPTPMDVRIDKIRLISPKDKAEFSSGDPQSYEWETVPGGYYYLLIHETLNADKEWVTKGGNPTVVFGPAPEFPYNPIDKPFTLNPGTYRWRVFTYGTGSYSEAYSVSPWRTYTIV